MNYRSLFVAVAFAVSSLSFASSGFADQQNVRKMHISVGDATAPNIDSWPFFLGGKLGFFKKRNIDIELMRVEIPHIAAALRSNERDPSDGVHATAISSVGRRMAGQGACATALVAFNKKSPLYLAFKKELSIADLRSFPGTHVFALSSLRGGHHAILRGLAGVPIGEQNEPFEVFRIGFNLERIAAVVRGDVDATIVPPTRIPFARDMHGLHVAPLYDLVSKRSWQEMQQGFWVLQDLLFATCEQVKNNESLYRDLVAAIMETAQYVADPANEARVRDMLAEDINVDHVVERFTAAWKDGKLAQKPDADKIKKDSIDLTLQMIKEAVNPTGKLSSDTIDFFYRLGFGWQTEDEIDVLLQRWRNADVPFFSLIETK